MHPANNRGNFLLTFSVKHGQVLLGFVGELHPAVIHILYLFLSYRCLYRHSLSRPPWRSGRRPIPGLGYLWPRRLRCVAGWLLRLLWRWNIWTTLFWRWFESRDRANHDCSFKWELTLVGRLCPLTSVMSGTDLGRYRYCPVSK
jgi:hypothetical protein